MFKRNEKKIISGLLILIVIIAALAIRNGFFTTQGNTASAKIAVKAMQVIVRDTPVNLEFTGQVKAKNEINIMSKVSGNIVAKMVSGGDAVYAGQQLYQIDNKQYLSSVRSARASLLKSQATYNNTQKDLDRYQKLAAIDGISRQTLDSYIAQAEEESAAIEVDRASLQQALEDEQDTLILSPIDGRIGVNEASIGDYVVAGSTIMATLASLDPIWVQFSMSENEYLKLMRNTNGSFSDDFKNNLKLILSDGEEYQLSGTIEQVDKGINDTTGTITIKANFANPQKMLLPGMFAKIRAQESIRKDALLIPQKAVKQVLDNTFVTRLTDDNKAESIQVKLGEKVDDLWIVESGLSASDRIIVDGIDKVTQSSDLQITMVQPDLQTPVSE